MLTAGSNLRDDLVEEVAAGTILHLYIQTSGSKRTSRASRSSTLASDAGCSVKHAVNSRSAGRAMSKTLCGAGRKAQPCHPVD